MFFIGDRKKEGANARGQWADSPELFYKRLVSKEKKTYWC